MSYNNLGEIVLDMVETLNPPERLTVSQASEKYRKLNNPGAYVGPWLNSTTPYLVEPMDCTTDRHYNTVVFAGPAQCGKALALTTPIPTPKGWTEMRHIRRGDMVFDETGSPCEVTAVTPSMFNHKCYEVVFDDGEAITADAEHKWEVDDCHTTRRVLTTEEMLPTYQYGKKRRSRYSIPVAEPLFLPAVELPLDPYTLGAWIGDGHSRTARIYGHVNDYLHIDSEIRRCGYKTKTSVDEKGLGVIHLDPQGKKGVSPSGSRGLMSRFRSLGLLTRFGGFKHIPPIFLRAGYEQRLSLLQGLMDTDGTIDRAGRCGFSTSNDALVLATKELIVSLGFKVQHSERIPTYTYKGVKRQGRNAHLLSFFAYSHTPVFRLPRKREKQKDITVKCRPSQVRRRHIVSIREAESVPVKCIAVNSPRNLYLCGRGMIPTHNTDLLLNSIGHSIKCDPMDAILYQTSQASARDFSRRRIDRLLRHSPEYGACLLPGADANNVFDKFFKSGTMFTLAWPSINELSGRPIGRVMLTDYDRMPLDIDGEGSPFDLARKRTTTFRSAGKTIVESSPGHPITDPRWIKQSDHEAPPCEGILALYNRGDRRRWHWKCPHCAEWFEPSFSLLRWPEEADIYGAAFKAEMMCPHCAAMIPSSAKYTLNLTGRWVRDGQRLTKKDELVGTAVRSDIASFWLKGPAATFASWSDIVSRWLTAEQEFQRTGSQEALKATTNTDQSEPYYPRGTERERLPEELKEKNAKPLGEKVVPKNARFLIATADVQKNRFVIQVYAISPANDGFDMLVIDRINIIKSERVDEDGERLWVKPATHLEDWNLLLKVLNSTYPLEGVDGEMSIKIMTCDSGGRDGVTSRAYEFWLSMRSNGTGDHKRFLLTKGDSKPNAPRSRISFPDAQSKDRKAVARGEIPVLMFNVNTLKDKLNGMLDAGEGEGTVSFADWLPIEVYSEMTAERRTIKGWERLRKVANEAWDLTTYALGVCVHIRAETIKWATPPGWAEVWEKNDLVKMKTAGVVDKAKDTDYDISELGNLLG